MVKRGLALIILVLMVPALSGCWYAAAAGAGAYVGYKAKEEGYKTQSPIAKEKHRDEEGKR
jgi:TRAP-type C4-dicarboxylate transport system permease large subunit